MKIAIVYGGQGSQEVGMGLDFYTESSLGKSVYDGFLQGDIIKEISFYSNKETLKDTQNTQPAMVAFQVMANELLKEAKIEAEAYCGLSIGEYGSLHGAGVLKGQDAVDIAFFRGEAMSQACLGLETKMYALLTSELDLIEELIERQNGRVEISNINSPNQIVIGGQAQEVEDFISLLRGQAIRGIELNVSGPFHTSYMDPVAPKLEDFFQRIDFNSIKGDLYLNKTGAKYGGEDLKKIMKDQVNHRVLLANNLEAMIKDGVDTFIEVGFHKVIGKIIKKMSPGARIYPMSSYKDYKKILEEIHGK